MSRFADPGSVEVIPIGKCGCPGTPHERDEATVRWDLGGSALGRIGRATVEGETQGDPFAGHRQIVLEAVRSWNLLAPDPDDAEAPPIPAPVNRAWIEELDNDTLTAIAEEVDRLVRERGKVPNASSAPSRASSRGSASRTPSPTRRRGT